MTGLFKSLPAIFSRRRRLDVDDVIRFYKDKTPLRRPKCPGYNPSLVTLTNTPMGLGDCVVLTDHIRNGGYAWSPSPHFKPLVDGNPHYRDRQTPNWVSIAAATASLDCGNGHVIQRIQRMFGNPVTPIPRGDLRVAGASKHPNRVTVHFESGLHAAHQKIAYHKRAREVYPENLEIIRKFFKLHPEYEVWELGSNRILGEPALDFTNRSISETMKLMANSSWHLGIISGPYHMATAFGLNVITIINFPKPSQLMIPNLVYSGVVESEWFAVQNMILHQDCDSLHWPKFSLATLSGSFQKEVYPYENPEKFANLITT